jgi:hypothetical protein
MSHITEVHCDPSDVEEERRRRLAACYSLLLDLAQKRRSRTSNDVPTLNPVEPVGTMDAEPQGYSATEPPQEL